MNILFIPNRDPRLKKSGSEQRTNLLWESLKRYGKVYTFQPDYNIEAHDEMIDGDHPIYKIRPFVKRISLWWVANIILSRLSSFSVFSRRIIKIEDPKKVFDDVDFDVVVTRYIYPLCNYKYWRIAPLLIDIDDHPYQVYDTVHKKKLPYGLRSIGKYVTRWQSEYLINKSVGGWIANQEQLNLCCNNYVFLPNIPQTPSKDYNADCNERNNLFTVGDMGYDPNREGVSRFLKQIWPSFHQVYPDIQYYIVGKGASETESNVWNRYDGVKYLGFVENLEALYEKCLASVVPVYSGGGTCIKTLEAMAYSRPCISTTFGARGLAGDVIERQKGVLIFDCAETFIKAYEELQNPSHRQKIEVLGRDVISRHYSVDGFNKAVDNVLSKIRREK